MASKIFHVPYFHAAPHPLVPGGQPAPIFPELEPTKQAHFTCSRAEACLKTSHRPLCNPIPPIFVFVQGHLDHQKVKTTFLACFFHNQTNFISVNLNPPYSTDPPNNSTARALAGHRRFARLCLPHSVLATRSTRFCLCGSFSRQNPAAQKNSKALCSTYL